MKRVFSRLSLATALGAALIAAACAHGANSVLPSRQPQPAPGAGAPVFGVSPDVCNKNVIESINSAGGVFKIPGCGGTTAAITYAANNAPAGSTATFLSDTSNPNPGACGTPAGETIVAYFTAQLKSTSSFVTFGTTTKKSHIGNPAFSPAKTYTIFGYAFGSEQFSYPLGHPNTLGVLHFASPLNNRAIPQGTLFCFELGTP